jgi:heme A synthase
MSQKQDEVVGKSLHAAAEKLFRELVETYAADLLLQSKLLAFRRGHDEVQSTDVNEAQEVIQQRGQRSRSREFQIIIGSTFIGAFIPGFINELSTANTLLLVLYVLMGFVGIFMVVWALRQI